jgi:hypothetical protein
VNETDSKRSSTSQDYPEQKITTDLNDRTSRIPIMVAFIIHLLVPLALCIDVIVAWKVLGVVNSTDKVVLAFSAMWLAIGVGVLLRTKRINRYQTTMGKSLLTIYSLYLSLTLLELSAHVFFRKSPPTLFSHGMKYVLRTPPGLMQGIEGPANFSVNDVGLRGPAMPHSGNVFKIVTVGGSTTASDHQDDSREWPHLLMEDMNAAQSQQVVWVGNAGVGGHTSVHHLALLQTLPILSQVDMLTFLVGINDLQATLAFGGGPAEEHLAHDADLFREQILDGGIQTHPLYRRLRLFRLSRKAVLTILSKFGWSTVVQQKPIDFAERRRRRNAAPVVALPDLQTGLKEYREHLFRIVHECLIRKLRCVFLTQPTMWRDNLTPAEQAMLWGPYVGRVKNPSGYLSAADAARAMDAYNQALLDLCNQNNMECYDLAASIPKDASAFYDDDHFNDSGARMVARFISDHLLTAPPSSGGNPETRLPAAKGERSEEVAPRQSILKENP